MKINKIFKISIHRVKQNKKRNLIIAIPIILITILLLTINIIQYSMENYIKSLENNLTMRTISSIRYSVFEYEEIIEKIENIDHVDMVIGEYEENIYGYKYCEQLKTKDADGYVKINSINIKTCPDITKGRKLQEDDKYVLIIPTKIYADSEGEPTRFRDIYIEKRNLNIEYINGEDLVGKKITISFEASNGNTLEKQFEIIGTYDSNLYNDMSTLYAPKEIIKEINLELNPDLLPELEISVVVDKIKNVELVKNELISQGLYEKSAILQEAQKGDTSETEANISRVTNINVETMNIMKKLIIFLLFASILIFLSFLITTNINKTYLSSTEIGVLKAEGYTNKDIQKMTIIENIIVCIISIIVSFIVFILIINISNIIMDYIIEKDTIGLTMNEIREQLFYIRQIPKKINPLFVLGISVLIIIIEVINTIFINKKILRKNIRELLKS